MPQSRWRWTSERRLTREGARRAHGRQAPPVCQRPLAHAMQEQCLYQSSSAAVISVWDRLSGTVSTLSYQQRACVPIASGDRDSPSSRSQVDRREIRPHLCAPAQTSVTALSRSPAPSHQPPSMTSASPSQRRKLPLLPSPRGCVSPYPSSPCPFSPQHLTVPSSCGQHQASTSTRWTGLGACRVLMGSSLARGMTTAHMSFVVPPRWPLHPQPTSNDSPTRLLP
jgi:hypothetical protein